MPRTLSANQTVEKNKLQSDQPWVYLLQINISGASGPYRLAAFDQDIVFSGQVFARYPLDLEVLEMPTHAALVQVRVTIGNVDQQLQALLETYWAPQANPQWEVLIWECMATAPNETPFAAAEVFSVQQITTDLVTAVADLVAEGLTLAAVVPKRRYTVSNGFRFIPRGTR